MKKDKLFRNGFTMSLLILGILSMASAAYGWGLLGHMIIAEVAQRHLSEKASKKLNNHLCELKLAHIANIPDEIFRADGKHKAMEPLHYVNMPKGSKNYSETAKNPDGDLVTVVPVLIEYLRSGKKESLDKMKALVGIDRTIGYSLLVHFVGDLHQPLHVGDPGDKGGNDVDVEWMGRDKTSLHGVWDSKFIEYTKYSYTEFADFLDRLYSQHDDSVWKNLNFSDWADQSWALNPQIYDFPDSQKVNTKVPSLSYQYILKNHDLLRFQLWVGGMRLAHVLNMILESAPD